MILFDKFLGLIQPPITALMLYPDNNFFKSAIHSPEGNLPLFLRCIPTIASLLKDFIDSKANSISLKEHNTSR